MQLKAYLTFSICSLISCVWFQFLVIRVPILWSVFGSHCFVNYDSETMQKTSRLKYCLKVRIICRYFHKKKPRAHITSRVESGEYTVTSNTLVLL